MSHQKANCNNGMWIFVGFLKFLAPTQETDLINFTGRQAGFHARTVKATPFPLFHCCDSTILDLFSQIL